MQQFNVTEVDFITVELLDMSLVVIKVLLILVATYFFAYFIRKFMDKYFEKSSKVLKLDRTNHNFLRYFVSAAIYLLGIGLSIYIVPSLRAVAVSIFASAGVLAVIIGFASQQAFSNVISGLFLVIFKPFRVGDRVKVKDTISGIVEDITLRHTVIRNFENKRILIPNSLINNEIIENYSIGDARICKYVEFNISYDSDIDKAMVIMREEAMKHPLFLDNRNEEEKKTKVPAVQTRLIEFGDSSVKLRAYVWTKDPGDAFVLGCDVNKSIKQRFDKEGIEIPFPYRTIVYKEKKKKGNSRTR